MELCEERVVFKVCGIIHASVLGCELGGRREAEAGLNVVEPISVKVFDFKYKPDFFGGVGRFDLHFL